LVESYCRPDKYYVFVVHGGLQIIAKVTGYETDWRAGTLPRPFVT
jgi:hypothetical protein